MDSCLLKLIVCIIIWACTPVWYVEASSSSTDICSEEDIFNMKQHRNAEMQQKLAHLPETSATHIEYDDHTSEGYIYSTRNSIYTLIRLEKSNLTTTNCVVSSLEYVTSFVQWHKSQLIIIESNKNCVLLHDRVTNMTNTLAGRCQVSGYHDNYFLQSIFSRPLDVILLEDKRFLVTDYYNRAIRSLDFSSCNVTTFISLRSDFPRSVAADATKANLYVTTTSELLKISLADKSVKVMRWYNSHISSRKALHSGIFWKPNGLIKLSDNHLIVADYGNRDLKLLELDNQSYTSINIDLRSSSLLLLRECRGMLIGEIDGHLTYMQFSGELSNPIEGAFPMSNQASAWGFGLYLKSWFNSWSSAIKPKAESIHLCGPQETTQPTVPTTKYSQKQKLVDFTTSKPDNDFKISRSSTGRVSTQASSRTSMQSQPATTPQMDTSLSSSQRAHTTFTARAEQSSSRQFHTTTKTETATSNLESSNSLFTTSSPKLETTEASEILTSVTQIFTTTSTLSNVRNPTTYEQQPEVFDLTTKVPVPATTSVHTQGSTPSTTLSSEATKQLTEMSTTSSELFSKTTDKHVTTLRSRLTAAAKILTLPQTISKLTTQMPSIPFQMKNVTTSVNSSTAGNETSLSPTIFQNITENFISSSHAASTNTANFPSTTSSFLTTTLQDTEYNVTTLVHSSYDDNSMYTSHSPEANISESMLVNSAERPSMPTTTYAIGTTRPKVTSQIPPSSSLTRFRNATIRSSAFTNMFTTTHRMQPQTYHIEPGSTTESKFSSTTMAINTSSFHDADNLHAAIDQPLSITPSIHNYSTTNVAPLNTKTKIWQLLFSNTSSTSTNASQDEMTSSMLPTSDLTNSVSTKLTMETVTVSSTKLTPQSTNHSANSVFEVEANRTNISETTTTHKLSTTENPHDLPGLLPDTSVATTTKLNIPPASSTKTIPTTSLDVFNTPRKAESLTTISFTESSDASQGLQSTETKQQMTVAPTIVVVEVGESGLNVTTLASVSVVVLGLIIITVLVIVAIVCRRSTNQRCWHTPSQDDLSVEHRRDVSRPRKSTVRSVTSERAEENIYAEIDYNSVTSALADEPYSVPIPRGSPPVPPVPPARPVKLPEESMKSTSSCVPQNQPKHSTSAQVHSNAIPQPTYYS